MENYKNIMQQIVKLDWMVKDYEQIDEDTFWVFGKLSDYGNRYLFKYSIATDIIRLYIIYYFGKLHGIAQNELVQILIENTGSYYLTSAYLGLELSEKDQNVYATFNSSLFFMIKQDAKDIAELISCAMMDIESSFINMQLPKCIITFFEEITGRS